MKVISIVIPTYNEEKNIPLVYQSVKKIFEKTLFSYEYRVLFIDNNSSDSSRALIKELSSNDNNVQYIFNSKNFGFSKSTFYGLSQSEGDCSILLFADMQDPPETIVDFVKEWESGNKVVVGIKNKSKENLLMYNVRKFYYWFIGKVAEIEHIEQFTGFGLYDKSVISTLRSLEDPLPYLRGIVAELAPDCKKVFYEQKKREHGSSSFNFIKLYDVAMLGLTSYSKALMRIATFGGALIALFSFIVAIVTLILKLTGIVNYPTASAAILFGVFFIGGVQLVFIGILGEYISNINIRTMKHPMVVEAERKGFYNSKQ